jgi:DNA-binding response OmpR family regulator
MPTVLLVEHEAAVRSFIQLALEKSGFEVLRSGDCVSPESPHDCRLECCAVGKPDLIIAAVVSPSLCSGVEAAVKAMREWGAKALLISATPAGMWPGDSRALIETMPAGSYSFLAKPFTAEALKVAVSALIDPTTIAP